MALATGYQKRFYRMGEVCELTDLESHVLRYWEAEIPQLSPTKSRGGQRLYRPEDIELIQRIKELVQERGFTIAGARRHVASGVRSTDLLDAVDEARLEVEAILTMMEANETL
ncbi:MAG: MerR family transcriptional regulator [Acidobacteria bacterium]|nr:MerR family transcriptional regulator [Acidobacteriota bacterium]